MKSNWGNVLVLRCYAHKRSQITGGGRNYTYTFWLWHARAHAMQTPSTLSTQSLLWSNSMKHCCHYYQQSASQQPHNYRLVHGSSVGMVRICRMPSMPWSHIPGHISLNLSSLGTNKTSKSIYFQRGIQICAQKNSATFLWGAACKNAQGWAAHTLSPAQYVRESGSQTISMGLHGHVLNACGVAPNPMYGCGQFCITAVV